MQTTPKNLIENEHKVSLASVAEAPILIGDLGDPHKNQTRIVAREDDFWADYLPALKVGDRTIKLSSSLRPTPGALMNHLAESDPQLLALKALKQMVRAASGLELVAMSHQLKTNSKQTPPALPQ